jgi:hypothetical protein
VHEVQCSNGCYIIAPQCDLSGCQYESVTVIDVVHVQTVGKKLVYYSYFSQGPPLFLECCTWCVSCGCVRRHLYNTCMRKAFGGTR